VKQARYSGNLRTFRSINAEKYVRSSRAYTLLESNAVVDEFCRSIEAVPQYIVVLKAVRRIYLNIWWLSISYISPKFAKTTLSFI
jgi:hypothetical protein